MDVRGTSAVGASAALGASIVTDLQPASGTSAVRVGPLPERAGNMAASATAERRYMFGLEPPHRADGESAPAQHARSQSRVDGSSLEGSHSHSGRMAMGGPSLSLQRTTRQSVFGIHNATSHTGRYLWRRCIRLCVSLSPFSSGRFIPVCVELPVWCRDAVSAHGQHHQCTSWFLRRHGHGSCVISVPGSRYRTACAVSGCNRGAASCSRRRTRCA